MSETKSMDQRYLETEKVGRLICRYSIPCGAEQDIRQLP